MGLPKALCEREHNFTAPNTTKKWAKSIREASRAPMAIRQREAHGTRALLHAPPACSRMAKFCTNPGVQPQVSELQELKILWASQRVILSVSMHHKARFIYIKPPKIHLSVAAYVHTRWSLLRGLHETDFSMNPMQLKLVWKWWCFIKERYVDARKCHFISQWEDKVFFPT